MMWKTCTEYISNRRGRQQRCSGLGCLLQLSRFGRTSYQVIYRDGETTFQIRVENASGLNRCVVGQVTLDDKVLPGNEIALLGDGRQHQVQVLMG